MKKAKTLIAFIIVLALVYFGFSYFSQQGFPQEYEKITKLDAKYGVNSGTIVPSQENFRDLYLKELSELKQEVRQKEALDLIDARIFLTESQNFVVEAQNLIVSDSSIPRNCGEESGTGKALSLFRDALKKQQDSLSKEKNVSGIFELEETDSSIQSYLENSTSILEELVSEFEQFCA